MGYNCKTHFSHRSSSSVWVSSHLQSFVNESIHVLPTPLTTVGIIFLTSCRDIQVYPVLRLLLPPGLYLCLGLTPCCVSHPAAIILPSVVTDTATYKWPPLSLRRSAVSITRGATHSAFTHGRKLHGDVGLGCHWTISGDVEHPLTFTSFCLTFKPFYHNYYSINISRYFGLRPLTMEA
jgi:hypothetical protein